MERQIHSIAELETFAKDLIGKLSPGETATLITLSGELGAGKTTLTQAFARELGITQAVTSPTFVLENKYELTDSVFTTFIHIDAYRLTNPEELQTLKFDDLLDEPKNLIVLEWPEKVAQGLPTPTIAIGLTPHEDGSRTLISTYAL